MRKNFEKTKDKFLSFSIFKILYHCKVIVYQFRLIVYQFKVYMFSKAQL